MDMKDLVNVDDFSSMALETMFAVVPQGLVGDVSQKYQKRKTENLFYVLFGVHMVERDEYMVLSSVFKSTKKGVEGRLFKEVMIDTSLMSDSQGVLNFLYDFVGDFTPHYRLLNEEVMTLGPSTAEDTFDYLSTWHEEVFDYFDTHIKVKTFGLDALIKDTKAKAKAKTKK